MNVVGLTISTGQGVALAASLVGLGCLLLGRGSISSGVLVSMTLLVALSGAFAVAQLIELQPTHALLSDSETTAPQKVDAPTNSASDVTTADRGTTSSRPDDSAHEKGDNNADGAHHAVQQPSHTQSPEPGDIEPGDTGPGDTGPGQTGPDGGKTVPSSAPTQAPVTTDAKPAGPPVQDGPAADTADDQG